MKASRLILALVAIASGSVFAQSANDNFIDRNVNQQQRIENGLQSGQLTTREAAQLEKREGRVESMEARAMRDGQVSQKESARIDHAQDQLSRSIYREKHDNQTGNPNSPSSQRMQQDVQRNVNQQQRIANGMQSGQLTRREAGRMERGESHINRMEGRAGANGHVGRGEQRRIQSAENHQSRNIRNERHDGQRAGQGHREQRSWQGGGRAENRQRSEGNNGNHFGQNNNGNHFGQNHAGRPSFARR